MGDESGKIGWMSKAAGLATEEAGMVEVDVDDVSLSKLRRTKASSADSRLNEGVTQAKQLSKPPLSPPRPVLGLSSRPKASPAIETAAASETAAPMGLNHVLLPALNDGTLSGGADGFRVEDIRETPKAANHRRCARLCLASLEAVTVAASGFHL
jgi:hypothetical protein